MPSGAYLRTEVFVFDLKLITLSGGRIRFFFALGRSGEMIGSTAAGRSIEITLYQGRKHLLIRGYARWRQVLFV